MINILFVHQSADLYGSDKTLLYFLKQLDLNIYKPVVLLPCNGPLVRELTILNIDVRISPVGKLYRGMFSFKGIYSFIMDLKKSLRNFNELNSIYKFDLVYSNTIAVFLGFFVSWKYSIPHIWHVHEIINYPRLVKVIYSLILSRIYSSYIIFNSMATKENWCNFFLFSNSVKYSIVYNGLEILSPSSIKNEIIDKYFINSSGKLNIVLVGRFNRLKGHILILEAFYLLLKRKIKARLFFIGSCPAGQEFFLENIKSKIVYFKLESDVVILPFQSDIDAFWQKVDIAVVPSTEPESFGLVALEAMRANKPVIASNLGGLKEVVLNNVTGILIKPSDTLELLNALEKLCKDPILRLEFGKNGFERFKNKFSAELYSRSIKKIIDDMINR